MRFIELVKKRQSIRNYSTEAVSREKIDLCIEAARLAPSACNSQPWSFIIVDDIKVKNEIVKKALSGIYSTNSFVKEAPVLIIVQTLKSTYIARMGGLLRNVKYNLIDLGIACDHLVLQAEELGLSTCFLGWFNEKAVKKVLSLPKSSNIDVMICMGYAGEIPEKTKERKPLEKTRRFFSK